MKIGIDARPLQAETKYRGIGKALGFFLEAFSKVVSDTDTVTFFIDATLPIPPDLKTFKHASIKPVKGSPLGRMRYVRSVLPAFPPLRLSKREVDVLLQYDASLGVPTNIHTVVVFHDLIPYLFRNQEKKLPASGLRKYKNSLAGTLYWKKYLRTLAQYRKAHTILAISASSKHDLLAFDPSIKPDSVRVVHLGARPHAVHGKPSSKLLQLKDSPFLLYVGGIDLRKNIVGLLEAFYELKPAYPELKLVCVGKEFGLENQLEDLGWHKILHGKPEYSNDVIIPGFVDEPSLTFLYEQARAFVFPSKYEGFGLPIIEAMQAGCPVIAYANSSITEVAGDAALLIKDGTPLAPAAKKLLDSKELRKDLIAKGKIQAKKFTWEHTATETLAQLRRAAK